MSTLKTSERDDRGWLNVHLTDAKCKMSYKKSGCLLEIKNKCEAGLMQWVNVWNVVQGAPGKEEKTLPLSLL